MWLKIERNPRVAVTYNHNIIIELKDRDDLTREKQYENIEIAP